MAESFGVNIETVKKLQRDENRRGFIVNVDRGLQVIRPPRMEEEEERGRKENGLEETYCSMRVRENIADPARADIYSARGGRIATLNSLNLPILRYLRLSAERGVLYRVRDMFILFLHVISKFSNFYSNFTNLKEFKTIKPKFIEGQNERFLKTVLGSN